MKKRPKKAAKLYRFKDNQGRIIELPGTTTMAELVKANILVKVSRPEEPLPPGWFQEVRS